MHYTRDHDSTQPPPRIHRRHRWTHTLWTYCSTRSKYGRRGIWLPNQDSPPCPSRSSVNRTLLPGCRLWTAIAPKQDNQAQDCAQVVHSSPHLKNMATFCDKCPDCYVHWSPPIILGTMNRYYCSSAVVVSHPVSAYYHELFANSVGAIVAMVDRSGIYVAHSVTGNPIHEAGDSGKEMIQETIIEIYNFVRTVHYPKANRSIEIMTASQDTMAALPPRSLSFFQDLLDQALPEVWKGKVKLMDKEEAPLCPACGFDLQEKVLYRR
jgi:hypothetical protein